VQAVRHLLERREKLRHALHGVGDLLPVEDGLLDIGERVDGLRRQPLDERASADELAGRAARFRGG
jgi:hypothetical protein